MVAYSVPTYSHVDVIVLPNSLWCEPDYCISFCVLRSLACRVGVAGPCNLRQLISTTMMISADTDFAIRGVWVSTDCVQLHVAITFLNDVILKIESVKDVIICVS